MTGWPYERFGDHHHDFNLCNRWGLPGPFDHGIQRMTMSAHLLSNWMGDDGFIRSLNVDVSEPYIYGDSLWVRGEVVEKYKEKLGGKLYGAVDVKIETVNQMGQNVAPGTATVYLPSINRVVELPIPQST